MWVVAIVFVGMVGFTLAVTSSKKDGTAALDGLRTWMKKFRHPWNPLRPLGHMLECSMCLGFWIGFLGTGLLYPILWSNVEGFKDGWIRLAVHLASGGMVSLASYIVDVVLRGVEAVVAEKENEHEYVRKQLARVHDKTATGEEADMAAGGGSAVEGPAGDQGTE
jgi:hypothetical protein